MNPGCEYRLWNDTEIALLAQRESPNVIWPVWDGFSPVEKADIFRYLVLWCFGGYYADADVECARPISTWDVPKDTDLIVGCFGSFNLSYLEVDQLECLLRLRVWASLPRVAARRDQVRADGAVSAVVHRVGTS